MRQSGTRPAIRTRASWRVALSRWSAAYATPDSSTTGYLASARVAGPRKQRQASSIAAGVVDRRESSTSGKSAFCGTDSAARLETDLARPRDGAASAEHAPLETKPSRRQSRTRVISCAQQYDLTRHPTSIVVSAVRHAARGEQHGLGLLTRGGVATPRDAAVGMAFVLSDGTTHEPASNTKQSTKGKQPPQRRQSTSVSDQQ